MFTANQFAVQTIFHQKFRSLIFFFCVLIASACLFGTDIFTNNLQSGVERAGAQINADLLVVPSECGDDAKGVLFKGEACTFLMKESVTEDLQQIPGIAQASEQLYLRTLSLPCCAAAGVQLIAINPETDFAVGEWLSGTAGNLALDEMIAGASCGLHVNDTISFYGRTFHVAGVLEETGMGYDESAFISFETANHITADPQYDEYFHQQTGLTSMVLIRTRKDADLQAVCNEITETLYSKGISVFATDTMVRTLVRQMQYFKSFGLLMNGFVIALAVVSLFSLVTITFYQQRNRVGSLLSVGIDKKNIIKIFSLEYLYLTLSGVFAGMLLVSAVIFPLHLVIKQALDLPYRAVSPGLLGLLALKTLVMNLMILIIAVSVSFSKILKSEPASLAEELS